MRFKMLQAKLRIGSGVVAGRAIHRLDQFWATGNIEILPTRLRIEVW
jgi:hypothetical protein